MEEKLVMFLNINMNKDNICSCTLIILSFLLTSCYCKPQTLCIPYQSHLALKICQKLPTKTKPAQFYICEKNNYSWVKNV